MEGRRVVVWEGNKETVFYHVLLARQQLQRSSRAAEGHSRDSQEFFFCIKGK